MQTWALQVVRLDFARAVVTLLELRDAACVDIETGHGRAVAREGDSHRQADIAQPNHRKLTIVWHGAFNS